MEKFILTIWGEEQEGRIRKGKPGENCIIFDIRLYAGQEVLKKREDWNKGNLSQGDMQRKVE